MLPNFSNICGRNISGIPGPRSATVTSTECGDWPTRTSTCSRVYFTALLSRFSIARWSNEASTFNVVSAGVVWKSTVMPRGELVDTLAQALDDAQSGLLTQSTEALRARVTPVDDWAGVEAHFAEGVKNPGWVDVRWSKPTGAALDKVVERLKALKLTIRNAPMGQTGCDDGACIFTGEPAVERILIGRAY